MNTRDDIQTGLRRIDDPRHGSYGWVVRVQRRGQVFTKFFADGVHGGQERALEAAQAHRAQLCREYPAYQRHEIARILRRNNTSSVPGVCRYGQVYWAAFWPTAIGQRKQVKFSIARYGEAGAFALAVAARQRALESLDEPFTRAVINYPKRRRGVKPTAIPDPRIRRVAILRYRLRVEIQDERGLCCVNC